jgi:hypothetical protein
VPERSRKEVIQALLSTIFRLDRKMTFRQKAKPPDEHTVSPAGYLEKGFLH